MNVKIAELDGRKQELLARIAELTVEAISPEQVSQISGYLDTWENVSFDDKRRVVDLMITTIAATSDSLNITWLKTPPDPGLLKILAKQRLDSCLEIVKEDYDMEYSLYLVKQIGIYAAGEPKN